MPLISTSFTGHGAVFDSTRVYRYMLWREWLTRASCRSPASKRVTWIGWNPSDADEVHDDPTVTKICGFTGRWGFTCAQVLNLYAYRAKDPSDLLAAQRKGCNVVGDDNDKNLLECVKNSALVVAAWGSKAHATDRASEVLEMITQHDDVWCIGTTKDGAPLHPSRALYTQAPILFKERSL